MPIYEYKCKKCGNKIESLQKIGDPDPKCECGTVMKKLMSTNSFILKGNGWYKTDYGNNKKEKEKD